MTSPHELREQAHELREVARTIRAKAAALDDDVVAVQTHYPDRTGGVWEGPAADEFFHQLTTVRTHLGALRTDVQGYAGDCEAKARHLDQQADELEAEQQKEKDEQ